MAWSFVGVTNAAFVQTTPIVLTEPAGVADGDLLIACIASRTTATTAVTATGWTVVGSQNNNNTLTTTSALASGTMLYRIRSGTPALSFTLPATVNVALGSMVAYRGSAATTPLDASTAATTAVNTLAVSVTGLTTTQDDDLIVAMAAGGQEASWSAFSNAGTSTGWSTTDKYASLTVSGTNNNVITSTAGTFAAAHSFIRNTNGTAGKYYAEIRAGTTGVISGINLASDLTGTTNRVFVYNANGDIYLGASIIGSVGAGAIVAADVICLAWDAGAERIWFRKNAGNWNNDASANPATGTNGLDVSAIPNASVALYFSCGSASISATLRGEAANFTQAVPSGFSAWQTVSLGPITASGATDTTSAPSPLAWIERSDTISGAGADTSLGVFDAVRTSTGATGNLTVTAQQGAGHVVIAGAFKITRQTADAWNDADGSASITLSNSDRTATNSVAVITGVRSTTTLNNETAGKYYAEFVMGAAVPANVGITPTSNALTAQTVNFSIATFDGGARINNVANVVTLGACAANDVVCVAWDTGAEQVWFRRNADSWNAAGGSADPASGAGGLDCSFAAATPHALWARFGSSTGNSTTIRTKLAQYTQAVPSGFSSWMGEAPATGNVTVNATGVAAGTALGTVTVDAVAPVSFEAVGVAATTALGTATATGRTNISTAATGVTATALTGTATASAIWNVSATSVGMTAGTALGTATATGVASASTTPVGQVAATALGNVSVAAGGAVETTPGTVAASAVTGTATVTAKMAVSTTPTGVAATAVTGTVGVAGAAVATPAGQVATTALGTVTVDTVRVASTTPTGVSATTALGGVSIAVGGGISITPSSLAVTAVAGTATVAAQRQVSTLAAGASATALSGTAGVSIRTSVAASGVNATALTGTATVTAKQAVSTAAVGVTASTALGGVSVAAGGSISIAAAGQSASALTGTATVTAKRVVSTAASGVAAASAYGVATVTTTTVVPADTVGVWTGSVWAQKPAKVWTGSAWMAKPVKTWNGGAWV